MNRKGLAPGVRISGVGRAFAGAVRALQEVTLTIPAGEITTIVGPSGCGKTTLLRIIAGLDTPTQGSVVFEVPPNSGTRPEVAFAFQEHRLLPWRTVLGNVVLPLELRGVPNPERAEQALYMASKVGLADALHRYPGQLSGGMRMRAALARALVTEPAVLLMDEPFGALDEITRLAMDDLLHSLWRTFRMTVVMVTHSITEAVYLGQQVVVMSRAPGCVVQVVHPRIGVHAPAVRATEEFATVVAQVHRHLERGMEVTA